MHEDFLLQHSASRELYHECAASLPIIDYHCHLSPQQIATDARFANLTELWLNGDSTMWRAMRACGVDERFITGGASDREKFLAWAAIIPRTLRNPLYNWTHLELARVFGIDDILLSSETAAAVWERGNEMLQDPDFSARGLLRRSGAEVVATTDDIVDDLFWHERLQRDHAMKIRVVPTFRPDRGMQIENGPQFRDWVQRLEERTDRQITTFTDLLGALRSRHDDFARAGCRSSDHGMEEVYADDFNDDQLDRAFLDVVQGRPLERADARAFKSAFLYHCGVLAHEKGWVFQLHIGAQRDNVSRLMRSVGPDAGGDSIGDSPHARPLARLLDRLDAENRLPRVIIYNNNPRDNAVFAALAGAFQDGSVRGKVQHGPAWWFLDHHSGIEEQLGVLSSIGILREFVGMTTDSRSLLSLQRHEYFRRILCEVLGRELESGLLPNDTDLLQATVRDVCYRNALEFFGFKVAAPDPPGRTRSRQAFASPTPAT